MLAVGMDVGGTTARIRMTCEQKVLFEAEGSGGTLLGLGEDRLSSHLSACLQAAFDSTGKKPQEVDCLCIGASGVDTPEAKQIYENILVSFGIRREALKVMNDGELLLHMFDEPCVVLISGTGSIALGRDVQGEVVRCGGWEHLVSDEGSATDLGMRVLKIYIHHNDGLVSAPHLCTLLEEMTGIQSSGDCAEFAAEHIMEKDEIARLAPVLEKAAWAGDAVALSALREAAQSICLLARCARSKTRAAGRIPVLLWGSVLMKNMYMQQFVTEGLRDTCRVVLPEITALDCAVMVAEGKKSCCVKEVV